MIWLPILQFVNLLTLGIMVALLIENAGTKTRVDYAYPYKVSYILLVPGNLHFLLGSE